MKTPAELARLYDAGALDEVAREALRYGAILADTEDPESLTRWRHVWHAGRVWEIEHTRGEVRGLGWKPAALGRNEARAVARYGVADCMEAAKLAETEGGGTVAAMMSSGARGVWYTIRQADAMINAGQALQAFAPK